MTKQTDLKRELKDYLDTWSYSVEGAIDIYGGSRKKFERGLVKIYLEELERVRKETQFTKKELKVIYELMSYAISESDWGEGLDGKPTDYSEENKLLNKIEELTLPNKKK